MREQTKTFLMFVGRAQDALDLYQSVFETAKLGDVERYPADTPDLGGQIMRAQLQIGGHAIILNDTLDIHKFTFTPSTSFFVECESEAELMSKHKALSDGGEELMPPGDYGFSQKFTWIADRFGVSWQLNLASLRR